MHTIDTAIQTSHLSHSKTVKSELSTDNVIQTLTHTLIYQRWHPVKCKQHLKYIGIMFDMVLLLNEHSLCDTNKSCQNCPISNG